MVNRYIKTRRGKGRSGEKRYFQMAVPRDLRPIFGATIEHCLRTDSLRVARVRRDALLPEIQAMFAAARAAPKIENESGEVGRERGARRIDRCDASRRQRHF